MNTFDVMFAILVKIPVLFFVVFGMPILTMYLLIEYIAIEDKIISGMAKTFKIYIFKNMSYENEKKLKSIISFLIFIIQLIMAIIAVVVLYNLYLFREFLYS